MNPRSLIGLPAFVFYVSTVVLANWAVDTFGVVPVGFGLEAPAGVYLVGIALALRDTVQRNLGIVPVLVAIALGAALSYLVAAPALAWASLVAFTLSETLDFAIYTPLRSRGWVKAVLASNLAGIAVDSVVFLWIAFGSLEFFWGQAWGKLAATLAFVAAGLVVQARTRYRLA